MLGNAGERSHRAPRRSLSVAEVRSNREPGDGPLHWTWALLGSCRQGGYNTEVVARGVIQARRSSVGLSTTNPGRNTPRSNAKRQLAKAIAMAAERRAVRRWWTRST